MLFLKIGLLSTYISAKHQKKCIPKVKFLNAVEKQDADDCSPQRWARSFNIIIYIQDPPFSQVLNILGNFFFKKQNLAKSYFL